MSRHSVRAALLSSRFHMLSALMEAVCLIIAVRLLSSALVRPESVSTPDPALSALTTAVTTHESEPTQAVSESQDDGGSTSASMSSTKSLDVHFINSVIARRPWGEVLEPTDPSSPHLRLRVFEELMVILVLWWEKYA